VINKLSDRFKKAQESLVVQQSDFSLKAISEMVSKNYINIEPGYQRRERWSLWKQAALIESFILNVPVPPIYLSEDDYGIYSVIDGKQRISAIRNFITDELKLTNLKEITELEGKTFSELPPAIQNALSIRPYIRVITLLKQSDPELKYEVFLRLNTGGEILLPQEIRNVAYSGPLNDLLFKLSENKLLAEKLKIKDHKSTAYQNMDDVEHVLRFFTLSDNWKIIGNILNAEMDLYMRNNRRPGQDKIDEMKNTFTRCIQTCFDLWGKYAFNKPLPGGWRAQLISPLYDAEMVAVSMLKNKEIDILKNRSKDVIKQTRSLFEDNVEFVKSVTQATNNPANIKRRISEMHSLLVNLTR
jgi:Protein of unknown function DUF262.